MTQFKLHDDKHKVIEAVCHAIGVGALTGARVILLERYRFGPIPEGYCSEAKRVDGLPAEPSNGEEGKPVPDGKALEVCLRDGFTDRYTGQKLVHREVLELITHLLPDAFPKHSHWAFENTHVAYYDLYPSMSHLIPVSRGGSDEMSNLRTASGANSGIKSNYLLEEIGERDLPPGDIKEWDGLLGWYKGYAAAHPRVIRAMKGKV